MTPEEQVQELYEKYRGGKITYNEMQAAIRIIADEVRRDVENSNT